MLTLASSVLHLPEGIRAVPEMGSILHGAMMEIISPDTARDYHTMNLRPYSQCIYWDRERSCAVWRIGMLTEGARKSILEPLLDVDELYLRQKNIRLRLETWKIIRETNYADLAASFIKGRNAPSGVDMSLLTSTSFKQGGRYVILPDTRLIFQSLIMRWNAFSDTGSLDDAELFKQMVEHCSLSRYRIHSQPYSVDGHTIYGFAGSMRYHLSGYDMMRRISGLLMAFAEFSGIGIKTALGMGAVHIGMQY